MILTHAINTTQYTLNTLFWVQEFNLYEVPRAVKFIEKESEELPEAGGRQNGELVFNQAQSFIWGRQKVLEMECNK